MKARLNGTWRAPAGMRLLASSLALAAAIGAAPPGGARAGSEPDPWPESLRAEALRAEGLRAEALRPEGLVSALRTNGAEIVTLGSRGGLDGYLVMPAEGTGYSLYVTEDGHAVAGLLYGPDGVEITGAQLAAAHAGVSTEHSAALRKTADRATTHAHATVEGTGTAMPAGSRSALFERSAAAFGFTLGDRGPLVVLLGDAVCPWSRSAAAKLGREALAGRLQLRVVPVAILGAGAARRAAAIAAHPDPARAWFEGPELPADRAGAERIVRNNALLDAWGANAVPLIAWTARDGSIAHRIGDIDDVGTWLRATLVPETLVPDTLRVGDARAGDPRDRDRHAGDARAEDPRARDAHAGDGHE